MIKLTSHGVYLVDGKIADSAALSPAEARKNTIAYSILQAHNTASDDALRIRFDALVSHDITYVGIIQTARASGLREFPIPYALTNCHNSLCAVGGTINEDDHVLVFRPPKSTAVSTYPPTRVSFTPMRAKSLPAVAK